MFPLTLNGTIRIRERGALSPRTIQDEIASTLLVSGVPVDYRPDGGIAFRLGVSQHFGWTFLLGVSSGTVRCIDHPKALQIRYRLRFLPLLLLVSTLLFICWRLELAFSPLAIPREYYLAVWLWLVCGNILVTRQEFRRFLRSCASDSAGRVFFWRREGEGPRGNG